MVKDKARTDGLVAASTGAWGLASAEEDASLRVDVVLLRDFYAPCAHPWLWVAGEG